MRRGRPACLAAAVSSLLLLVLVPSAEAAPIVGGGPAIEQSGAFSQATAKCQFRWHRKKVVRFFKRHGKRKRIVRYRWRKVCVPVPTPAPARISVKAFEFGFILSTTSLAPGDTIAELNNSGEDPHDLHIQQVEGGPETVFPETLPSTFNRVRFETETGTYRLGCSLPFHAERGMDTSIEVRPEAS